MSGLLERFMAKVSPEPNTGCWLWMGHARGGGYGGIRAHGRKRRVHRVAWELFRGPISKGLNVLHHCDVRPCVNPAHLFLGTQRDNMRDMVAKGRATGHGFVALGEKNGHSKLTAADVVLIRNSRGVVSQRALARRFGVNRTSVRDVQVGKTWRHITEKLEW